MNRSRFIQAKSLLEQKAQLSEQQRREAAIHSRRHELQKLDMQRMERALALVEKRERKALETALLKEARLKEHARLKAREPERAVKERTLGKTWEERARPDTEAKRKIDLRQSFTEAARSDEGDSSDQGDTDAPAPEGEAKIRRRKRRKMRLEREFNKAADPERDGDDGGSGGGPRVRRCKDRDPPEPDGPPRPRRTRKRDFDRGM